MRKKCAVGHGSTCRTLRRMPGLRPWTRDSESLLAGIAHICPARREARILPLRQTNRVVGWALHPAARPHRRPLCWPQNAYLVVPEFLTKHYHRHPSRPVDGACPSARGLPPQPSRFWSLVLPRSLILHANFGLWLRSLLYLLVTRG